jgi:bis(5'-nucleosyl)-tetraphosphatase (symmetrical)
VGIYAIGDIQGCYDPFRRLLDKIKFEPGKDKLLLAGDLVNRGPHSLKTLRFVRKLGDSAISVLGNHDLHLLAIHYDVIPFTSQFSSLEKLLNAPDANKLCKWLRHRPLAHWDSNLNTLLVHAGTHPDWSARKTLEHAQEVEFALQDRDFKKLLEKMYGNTPTQWSGKLTGYKRLRYIINCLTRMRMITTQHRLNFSHNGSPWRARKNLIPWYNAEPRKTKNTRVVFGHWSQLGLIVLPNLLSLDTGCVWGRELTAVRLDKRVARIVQVEGQAQ